MNLHAPSPDLRMPLGEKLRRVNQQPQHDEQPDLSQPRQPLDEGPRGGAVRQPGVAQHHRGDVDGEESAAVQMGAAGVAEQA